MKKLVAVFAASAASFSLGGCATVLNGTSQDVEFRSDPDEANVELVNGLKCQTPCTYSMKRGDDSKATITKEGYKPAIIYIQSRTGGATFGNILAGGIIGGVVDGSNGASNHLYPNPVSVQLAAVGSDDEAVLLNKDGSVVSTVAEYNAKVADDVLKGLEAKGYYARGEALTDVPSNETVAVSGAELTDNVTEVNARTGNKTGQAETQTEGAVRAQE